MLKSERIHYRKQTVNAVSLTRCCGRVMEAASYIEISSYVEQNPNDERTLIKFLDPNFFYNKAPTPICNEDMKDRGRTADIIACAIEVHFLFQG